MCVGVKGAGQVVTTSFSVPATSIDWWRNRFVAHDLTVRSCGRMDASVLQVSDPSGLSIELIGDATDRRPPWTGNGVDAGMAIRGLHSITAIVKELGPTLRLMIDTFGFAIVAQEGARTRLAAGADAPGHYIDVIEDPHAETAVNGLGTVHHVAMSIGSAEESSASARGVAGNGIEGDGGARPLLLHVHLLASRAACCSKWRPHSRDLPWTRTR